jgi:hypothetical protein
MSQLNASVSVGEDAMTAEQGEAPAPGWPWPDSLDALSAAPRRHTLLLEKEHVRVLETRIPPGDRAPVHTHRWPSVLYVFSWSDFPRRDEAGTLLLGRLARYEPLDQHDPLESSATSAEAQDL